MVNKVEQYAFVKNRGIGGVQEHREKDSRSEPNMSLLNAMEQFLRFCLV